MKIKNFSPYLFMSSTQSKGPHMQRGGPGYVSALRWVMAWGGDGAAPGQILQWGGEEHVGFHSRPCVH